MTFQARSLLNLFAKVTSLANKHKDLISDARRVGANYNREA